MVCPPFKKEYTSDPNKLRKIFNRKYLPKIKNNELILEIRKQNHLKRSELPDGMPYCTHSQMVNYKNQKGVVVALAHRYLLPDGTIGASGKPDPKFVVTNDNKILCYNPCD